MADFHSNFRQRKKKVNERQSEREVSTALFLLRCVELGLSLSDLDEITIGMVFDMFTEKSNDDVEYDQVATQEDIDNF